MRGCLVLLRNMLIPIILAVILLGILAAGALVIIGRSTPHLNPVDAFGLRLTLALRSGDLEKPAGSDPAPICFSVAQGDTAGIIAGKLNGQGFDLDGDLFRAYVRYFNIDSSLQAGTFLLNRTLTIPQIAQKLTNSGADSVTFRVLEGWRSEEIAAVIDSTPNLTFRGADFLTLVGVGATSQPGYIGEFATRAGIPAGKPLEGFLFPDTYALPTCGTASDLVVRMLQNFELRVTAQMRTDASTANMTLYEAVTLASIVQREAVLDEERPLIASVYLNRYRNNTSVIPDPNIPRTLDADPTIQYALGSTRNPGTWWPPLSQADYRGVVSPYNTYLNPGLPPTPIANPGLASIQGVIYPQQSAFIYFRACPGEGGRHRFSTNFAEHNNACG